MNEETTHVPDTNADEIPQPIGRTSATEREAITSDKFAFWLPDDVIVNPFDIVAVEQVNQPDEESSRTYGLVTTLEHRTDAPNHLANFISSSFGDLPADQVHFATELFKQLQEFERQEINGIWARIIKNAFAPLFQGRFDYVAGNPPWVNWESLPGDYRRETMPLWVYHNLFPHSGMDTILGKGKKDISMLMSYVAMDNYLKDGARLGFLITQSVFKTAGAGQGFRGFRLGSDTPVAVIAVDDMSKLKPFQGAANRTAIVVLERGRITKYPMRSYNWWYKPGGGSVIPEDMTIEELRDNKIATYRQHVARPVDEADPTSPWLTGRERALEAIGKVLGASDYHAHEGVNSGGANAVYWLEIVGQRPDGLLVVSSLTKGARRKVEQVQTAIEPDLVYPLLRGRDVRRWQATPSAHILVVQDPKKRRGYDQDWLSVKYPKTYAYLKHFEDILRTRSGYRRYFKETDPFYSLFNVGDYTFAPCKVVWPWISKSIRAAVVSTAKGCAIIPDNNVTFIETREPVEAHFIAAVLNCSVFSYTIQSFYAGGGGGIGRPAALTRARVPRFESSDPVHGALATLSQQAHAATAAGDAAQVEAIEAEIDRLAAQLWGLTEEELKEIQRNLAELR